jgi:hypothetical protein
MNWTFVMVAICILCIYGAFVFAAVLSIDLRKKWWKDAERKNRRP